MTRAVAHHLPCSILVAALAVWSPVPALAHCDGLDGPVVKAARTALDTRNVDAVLMWVKAEDEPEMDAPSIRRSPCGA